MYFNTYCNYLLSVLIPLEKSANFGALTEVGQLRFFPSILVFRRILPILTGVVWPIVLRPLLPLKFDLKESGGDPDDSVCVVLLAIIGPELT